MSALDIPPHPRRTSAVALGLIALVAAAAFTQGLLRQLTLNTPPHPVAETLASDVPEAQPIAPSLQIAQPMHVRHDAPEAFVAPRLDVPDQTSATGSPPEGATGAPAIAVPAADASTTVAEPSGSISPQDPPT